MYYILLAENSIFMDFCAVKLNGSDPGICVIVKTRSYGHIENISLDSNQNWYYLLKINKFSNPEFFRLYTKTPWSCETDS